MIVDYKNKKALTSPLYQRYNTVDDWQYETNFLSGTTFTILEYTLKAFFSA